MLLVQLSLGGDESRVLGDVLDEGSEGRVTEERLDQRTVASVLLSKSVVLRLESADLLSLNSDFAFELANVFFELSVESSM